MLTIGVAASLSYDGVSSVPATCVLTLISCVGVSCFGEQLGKNKPAITAETHIKTTTFIACIYVIITYSLCKF
jgi:hypothetical protein